MYKILTVNTGSTSTKLAIFEDENCILRQNIKHQIPTELRSHAVSQIDIRLADIQAFLTENGYKITDFDILGTRCGFVPYGPAHNYKVDQYMVDMLTYAPALEHASNVAAVIGVRLTEGTDIPIVAPNPPSTDEMNPIAKVTGLPGVQFESSGHVLNAKQVCRETAQNLGIPLEQSRFVVCHIGGGCSVSALEGGRIVDIVCSDTGPMSSERIGWIPPEDACRYMVEHDMTLDEINDLFNHRGGFYAITGTNDALEIENRALAGDETCIEAYAAMAYQFAKSAGSFIAALKGKVDGIIITGSIAYSKYLTDQISEYVSAMAPVYIIPGEREMEALAGAAYRVISGQEEPYVLTAPPAGYATREEFMAYVAQQKK